MVNAHADFRIYASSSARELADQLAINLKQSQQVFVPTRIVTHNAGMASWLKEQLVERLEIVANVDFIRPLELTDLLLSLIGIPSSGRDVTLPIYSILGEPAFLARYHDASRLFLNNADKRYLLAENLSKLFHHYQVVRPDLIRTWNRLRAAESWQHHVWLRLKEDALLQFQDIASKLDLVNKGLEENSDALSQVGSLHFFGWSVLGPSLLEHYKRLATYVQINFYVTNPAPDTFWFAPHDIGNELLMGWGKQTRSNLDLLFSNEELTANYFALPKVEPPETLLAKVQDDIASNALPSERHVLDPHELETAQLKINFCKSAAAEVEALHDYLSELVVRHPNELSARDMLVCMPEVERYAPLIRSVFGHSDNRFPFSIADEKQHQTTAQAFLSLLSPDLSELLAEDVLGLLDWPSVAAKFQIYDTALLRRLVVQAGIKRGIRGQKGDETYYVSWEFGLKRLMYGICAGGFLGPPLPLDLPNETFYPADLPEGDDAVEVIHFCYFINKLISKIELRQSTRTVLQWLSYCDELLENFIEQNPEDLALLRSAFKDAFVPHRYADERIPFSVFVAYITLQVEKNSLRSSLNSNGIIFSSLIPLRPVCYKVVCLLGMNDNYPAAPAADRMDLSQQIYQSGDFSKKEADKQLFLDLFLAASFFYASFSSKNEQGMMRPSAMVEDLCTYIEQGSSWNLISSYQQAALRGKWLTPAASFKPHVQPASMVALSSFVRFLKNPTKFYYNEVLQIHYEPEQGQIEAYEPFDVDNLTKWTVKSELFATNEQPDELKKRLVQAGAFPLRNVASIYFEQLRKEIEPLKNSLFARVLKEPPQGRSVRIDVGPLEIEGMVEPLYRRSDAPDRFVLVRTSFSGLKIKHLMETAALLLAAKADNLHIDAYLIFEFGFLESAPVTQAEARHLLVSLTDYFQEGIQTVPLFVPDLELKRKDLDKVTHVKGWLKARVEKLLNRGSRSKSASSNYLALELNGGMYESDEAISKFVEQATLYFDVIARVFPTAFD